MWQRFTERARRIVFFAQEEAEHLGENHVSTEHLLLGLTRENDSVAARVLDRLGVSLGRVRDELERQVARGDGRSGEDIALTPRAKRVIDLAYDEARQFGHIYIGTEHLLLGLIREGEGLAGRILSKLGVDLERARQAVVALNPEHAGDTLFDEVQAGKAARRAQRSTEAQTEREAADARQLRPGDLGVVRADGRSETEIAADARAYVGLAAIFAAKDAHGYHQMASGDQTLFLVPNDTPVKWLVSVGDGANEAAQAGGVLVRVLSGPHDGVAGWMNRADFSRTGPDEAVFPPMV